MSLWGWMISVFSAGKVLSICTSVEHGCSSAGAGFWRLFLGLALTFSVMVCVCAFVCVCKCVCEGL